jgi:hypothetical protein
VNIGENSSIHIATDKSFGGDGKESVDRSLIGNS